MSNYYTPSIQMPTLKTSLENVRNLTENINQDAFKPLKLSISKNLNIQPMSDVLEKVNVNDIFNEQFKKMNISNTLKKAISDSVNQIKIIKPKKPDNNSIPNKEEVVKFGNRKVESYTEIDNSTGEVIKMNSPKVISTNTIIEIDNDITEITKIYDEPDYVPIEPTSIESPNVNKNPFSLTRGKENMNHFLFSINIKFAEEIIKFFFPKVIDGTVDYYTFSILISLTFIIANATKDFDKDKYNNNI